MADAGLTTSALIFDEDGSFLIRAGNTDAQGADFVRMHYYLALVIAQLDAMGERRDLSVVEQMASPSGKDPAEIALRMAQCVPNGTYRVSPRTESERWRRNISMRWGPSGPDSIRFSCAAFHGI